jgi:hypothetical protein
MTEALMTAAAMQMARDELWRNPPPLAADCEHDLLCLLVIEVRQTVICRKCGGLDIDTSRRVLAEPAGWISDDAGAPVQLLESGPRVTYELTAEEQARFKGESEAALGDVLIIAGEELAVAEPEPGGGAGG